MGSVKQELHSDSERFRSGLEVLCVSIACADVTNSTAQAPLISFRKKVQSTAQLTKEGNIDKIEHRNFYSLAA